MLVEWPDRLAHAGVTLPGSLEVDIQLQVEREKEYGNDGKDDDNDDDFGESDKMLTEAMMEKWISQPRSITLTLPKSATTSVWSHFTL